jgi:hypothetical protein
MNHRSRIKLPINKKIKFINKVEPSPMQILKASELERIYPLSTVVILNFDWIDGIKPYLDFIPPEIIVDSVSMSIMEKDIYTTTINNIAAFLEACGYRSTYDVESFDLVGRLLNLDNLMTAIELTSNTIGNDIMRVVPDFEDYILLDWLDNELKVKDAAMKVFAS